MKISCPIFSIALCAALTAPTQAQAPPSFAGQGGGVANQNTGGAAQDAESLIERVERNIEQLRSLSAKVRNQVDLFDHQVTGTGLYLQQGSGLRQLSRFELTSQVGDTPFTLLEVNDGRYFWTFRELPNGPSLTCLDLVRIQEQLLIGARPDSARPPGQMPIGGLSKLLDGLRRTFQFDRVGETQLGERRVWVVDGQWRPAPLAAAVPPELRSTIEAGRTIELKKLPAHLPEHVVLYIGQSDLMLYRIEYLRRNDKADGAGQGGILPGYRAMVTTEFFDVRLNGPIEAREFIYQPSGRTQPNGLKVIDMTDAYLKAMTSDTAK